MSQYIAVEVSSSMTWTFNTLSIINDLIFAYFLHKISKRVPIPFQYANKDTEENIVNNMDSNDTNTNNQAVSLLPLNNQQPNPNPSTQTLQYNFHNNNCVNICYTCDYKLTIPTYPSYFFDDITYDQRKEVLEDHWQTIQDQSLNDNILKSRSRQASTVTNPTGIFAITVKRMTGLVFKKRSYIQYASLSLRVWSVCLGIIALALSWSFWMNMLLEYCIACIFNRGTYIQLLGLLAVFAIIHCSLWWLKRQWQSLLLLWYNTADHFYVIIAIWWRLIHLLLCLSFTLWSSIDSNLTVSDSVFWQLFLRWMVLHGLLWEIGYAAICFLINIRVVYRLYSSFDFKFMKNLGKSHLKSIRKTINNISNVLTKDNIEIQSTQISENMLLDENENKEQNINDIEPSLHRKLTENEINDLTQLHQMEATQQNLLQSMQLRSVHQNNWYTFVEILWALKENEDMNRMICYGKMKLIYIKYVYICMVFIAIIICFSVGDEDGKSMCTFAGWIFTMYYFIVLFRRAKYNALFCFWSSKYHSRFYNNLQIIYAFEEQKRAESRRASKPSNLLINEELQNQLSFVQAVAIHASISDESDEQKSDYFRIEDEKQDTSTIQPVKIDSTFPYKDITVFKDDNRNIFIQTMVIDYMDFWSMIELDENDFYGCAVFCGATKELCAAVCAIILVIIFVALAISFSSNTTNISSVYVSDSTDHIIAPYPMCQVDWGRNYLNLLDMIYLTIVAYYSQPNEIKNLFELWFGLNNTGWDFENIHIEPKKPAFFHISNINGLEVVAVRGTYDMDDVLQDISLYTEIATLQTFSWIIPLTTVLPVGFIRDFVKYASIPEGMIDPTLRERYDEPIYDYVWDKLNGSLSTAKVESGANKTIFIMGHSLGGGVAEIVAAKFADQGYTNVYSFGLSSPGTLWSSLKFGFSVEALDKSSVSVLPRRDPISLVDNHGGVSQVIECNAKETLFCHLSERSFCEIYQECGIELVRNLSFTNCVCGNETNAAQDWPLCW
eukprot:428283_1